MNNIKIRKFLLAIALILSACSASNSPQVMNGDVLNLYHTTAEWIIDGCLSGEVCGSQIFTKGDLVVYARPFLEHVAFIVTNKGVPVEKVASVTGNLVTCETWAEFKTWLIDSGFGIVTAGAPAYRALLDTAAKISSMELVPVFSFIITPPNHLPTWVTGAEGDA